jgi:hypothetical protein
MEQFITLVSGPFGALALSVGILVWLAKIVVPILKAYLEGQNEKFGVMAKSMESLAAAVDRTVSAHEADRTTFENTIATLTTRVDKIEVDVHHIRSKLP